MNDNFSCSFGTDTSDGCIAGFNFVDSDELSVDIVLADGITTVCCFEDGLRTGDQCVTEAPTNSPTLKPTTEPTGAPTQQPTPSPSTDTDAVAFPVTAYAVSVFTLLVLLAIVVVLYRRQKQKEHQPTVIVLAKDLQKDKFLAASV